MSQSTFSRAARLLKPEILVTGRASGTRYALRRDIPGVGSRIPIFELDETGRAARFGQLEAVHPRGFHFQPGDAAGRRSRFFPDLPYFLDDLRPAGFLGRLIPKRHPDLDVPRDITEWNADDCLRYLTRFGTDLIGNLILGDGAFARYLDEARREGREAPASARAAEHPRMAEKVLQFGDPGSSAGGEQPKFSALAGPGRRPVLVKFSPKVSNDVARRWADLLVCEHLALRALAAAGHPAAKSELLAGGDRTFLEVERFDRVPPRGRRGVISLSALDAELAGRGGDWSRIADRLFEAGRIDAPARDGVRWRELFGRLIGDTDMHPANLSFFFREPSILELAPAYDMLPMLYAPQSDQLVERSFRPPPPRAGDSAIWESACAAAAGFWEAVGGDQRVSAPFRALAISNAEQVRSAARLKDMLP